MDMAHAIMDPLNLFSRSVIRACGRSSSSQRIATLVEPNNSARYLAARYLGEDNQEHPVGKISLPTMLWRYRRLAGDSGLLVAKLSRRVSGALARTEAIRVPDHVRLEIELPLTERARSQIRRGQRGNLQRIAKNNLSYRVTQNPADFDRFYFDMHRPYVESRYGSRAELFSYEQARDIFRGGVLMWALQHDRIVAGRLIKTDGDTARAVLFGTQAGGKAPVQAGAHSALYHYSIQWATEQGFKRLDVGRSRPVLADGVLVAKRRWGAELGSADTDHDLLVYWNECTDAVRQFLAETPLIFRDDAGLSGITAILPGHDCGLAAARAQASRHWIEGLRRLIVICDRPVGSRESSQHEDAGPVWIAPATTPAGCLRAARSLAGEGLH